MPKYPQTVYLLHGWAIDPDNEQKWSSFRSQLQKQQIESIFLRIPGLDTPLEKPWQLNDYVSWLEKTLPDKPVVLLCHSFGGQIGIRFAAHNHKRLVKLILMDSSGIIDRTLKKILKRFIFKYIAKVGKIFGSVPYARMLFYKLTREKDYYAASPVMRQTMANVLQDEITSDISQIVSDTLIIWGEHDLATPFSNTSYLLKIPGSKLKVVAGARHCPQYTHPEEVAKHVAEFIQK